MTFEKGHLPLPKGSIYGKGRRRKKGPDSKLFYKKGEPTSMKAREVIELAFEGIGGLPAIIEWAQAHPTEFYTKIYIRLLPVHMHMENANAAPVRVDDARHRLAQLLSGLVDAAAKRKDPVVINGRAERSTDP